MVHKNEHSSSEMMALGSALAVIRYNDGFQGIRKLFDLVQVPISTPLSQVLHQIDRKRVLRSFRTISEQKKRYAKKQRRGKSRNMAKVTHQESILRLNHSIEALHLNLMKNCKSSGFNAHPAPLGITWSAWGWKMTTSEKMKAGVVMCVASKVKIDRT